MYCPNCGKELIPGAKFCGCCGKPISFGKGTVDISEQAQNETAEAAENRMESKPDVVSVPIIGWKKVLLVIIPVCIVIAAFAALFMGLFGSGDLFSASGDATPESAAQDTGSDVITSENTEETSPVDELLAEVVLGDIVDTASLGNDVIWTLYEDGICIISGEGAMYDFVSANANFEDPDKAAADYALFKEYADWIQILIVQEGVTNVGYALFRDLDQLQTAALAETVTSIDDKAFYSCSSLQTINIPDQVTYIGERAFCACHGLTSISIPGSVYEIGEGAFEQCSGLERVSFEEGLVLIGDGAFQQCSLTSLDLPDTVTTIGGNAFSLCDFESVVLPDSVVSISGWSFRGCDVLKSFTLSASMTLIDEAMFYSCENLESLVIPVGITQIGTDAFALCSSLTDIYYGGTEEQWENVDIEDTQSYFDIDNLTIHYNSQ